MSFFFLEKWKRVGYNKGHWSGPHVKSNQKEYKCDRILK